MGMYDSKDKKENDVVKLKPIHEYGQVVKNRIRTVPKKLILEDAKRRKEGTHSYKWISYAEKLYP